MATATITVTGQKARVSRSIIAGQPRSVSIVEVVSIDGDVLTYTVDRVWFSTVNRDDLTDWELIDEAERTVDFMGSRATAYVPVSSLERWIAEGWAHPAHEGHEHHIAHRAQDCTAPERVADPVGADVPPSSEVCPLHGPDCEVWA